MNTTTDTRATFEQKVKRGIFNPVARHLHPQVRDDRFAEGLALTFELFAAHAERGIILDDALLVHACRLRAQDLGRCLVRAGTSQRRRGVMDIRNFLDGKVEVLQLDEECPALVREAQRSGDGDDAWIVSTVDLERWLASLPAADRQLLSLRYEGNTLHEIARVLRSSTSAVFSRLKRLGSALAAHLGLHVHGAANVASVSA